MTGFDRYERFEQLAEDPYGKVFRARDHQAERWVAVLEMHERFRANPDLWEEVWSGVVRRANLRHEYLTTVHDLLKSQGWIVCELMRGDMGQLADQGPVDAGIVRTVLRRALEGLTWLHTHDEWHGGLRPGNLQYDREGAVKLAFSPGFMIGGQIPHQGQIAKYLAPELLKPDAFGPVGPGVDLYCLGLSGLALLLGSKKFDGLVRGGTADAMDPNLAWLRWHAGPEHLPAVAELVPGVPQDVANVIDHLLKKPVADRCPSAEAALRALDSARPEVLVPVAALQAENTPAPAELSPAAFALPRASTAAAPAATASVAKAKKPRSWMQQKLDNPLILTAVISTIVGVTAAVIWAQLQPPTARQLIVESVPDGATIYVDGKKSDKLTNTELTLRVGKRKIRVEKAGYPRSAADEQEVDLTSDKAPKKILFTLTSAAGGTTKPIPKPSATNTATETTPAPTDTVPLAALPAGLKPLGKEVDAKLRLPLKAMAVKLADTEHPLEFALIAPGKFVYGADEPLQPGELKRQTAEIETPYYISLTEVSQAQWQHLANSPPEDAATDSTASDNTTSDDAARDLPVTNISYSAAQEFCKRVSPVGRLPRELEWERAARGTTGRLYPWGDAFPTAETCNITFDAGNRAQLKGTRSLDGGRTPEGVRHLLGNAAEWCDNVYEAGFDDDGVEGLGEFRAIRGASILERSVVRARATWRANLAPEGAPDVGFRVVVPVTVSPQ